MASVALLPPPLHAPGKDVAKFLAKGIYAVKSEVVNYNDTSPLSVIDIPANTLILSVAFQVTTAWNGAIPSLSLGVSGATARHLGTGDLDIKTAGYYPKDSPYEYTADAVMIATLVASTATQGAGYVWVLFRPFSNKS